MNRIRDLIARSDGGGNFQICVPAMPALDLSISHPEFATLATTYYAHQPFLGIRLEPAALVHLALALPDGSPACGFHLQLEGMPDDAQVFAHRKATTDERGECEFLALRSGTYAIRYLGGHSDRWALPVIAVPCLRKGERREIKAEAVRGSILHGTVTAGESGEPIHHAEVRFQSAACPHTPSTFQAAGTDIEGRYEFRYPIAPGPLNVRVYVHRDGSRIRQDYHVVIKDQARTEVNFRLALPGNLPSG